MAGDQNTKTPAVGSYPACCSYYHYYNFHKSDSCLPPGDIKSSLVKARKPVAFMVMAPSFLDAVPFSRSTVIGFFLSCFADPFLCDHNGHYVPDYRALSLRTGKGAAKNDFLGSAFFSDKTGNPSNHSAGPFDSLDYGAWLAYAAGPVFDDFFFGNGRNFSRLG